MSFNCMFIYFSLYNSLVFVFESTLWIYRDTCCVVVVLYLGYILPFLCFEMNESATVTGG